MNTPIATCRSCGEPEEGGDFGWFDTDEYPTTCNRCGADPTKAPRRKRTEAEEIARLRTARGMGIAPDTARRIIDR